MKDATLLLMLATGAPLCCYEDSEAVQEGLVGADGRLTEKGREKARKIALADPEIHEEFKARIRRGEV